jgi:transposase-like protein
VFVKVSGVGTYLWRAADEDGDVLEIIAHRRRDKAVARGFDRPA